MRMQDHAERATLTTGNRRGNPRDLTTPRSLRATSVPREIQAKSFSSRLRQKSGLTLRITRRLKPIPKHNSVRVGGRVHALVMRRPSLAETRMRRNTSFATRAPRRRVSFRQSAA